jgi:hypothetical protein
VCVAERSRPARTVELVGMDRTRVRDGLVCENDVFFDLAQFQQLVGE